MLWRPYAMTLQVPLSPGSVSSMRRAKSVQDHTNSTCWSTRALFSTPKALPIYDVLAGKVLTQSGQQPTVSHCSPMSVQMHNNSTSSDLTSTFQQMKYSHGSTLL